MKKYIRKASFEIGFPFIIFILATTSQFLFDTFGSSILPDESFRSIISTRSLIIMVAPILIFGLDQSVIRFNGIARSIYIHFNTFLLSIFILVIVCVYKNLISLQVAILVVSVYIFSYGLLLSSFYRIKNSNFRSQLLINGWRVILYIGALLYIPRFELDDAYNYILSLFLLSFAIPVFFLFNKSKVSFISEDKRADFSVYSFIFMIFIFMLAFSQYADQLFATYILDGQALKYYVYYSAIYIAPSTIVATFIGFILAPRIARMEIYNVKGFYRKMIRLFSIAYPFYFALILMTENLISNFILVGKMLDFSELFMFGVIGYLRLIYSFNSTVMGMKSDKFNLFLFFCFCLCGIVTQTSIIYSTTETDFVVFYLLLSVALNWSLRNLGATYIIERRLCTKVS